MIASDGKCIASLIIKEIRLDKKLTVKKNRQLTG